MTLISCKTCDAQIAKEAKTTGSARCSDDGYADRVRSRQSREQ